MVRSLSEMVQKLALQTFVSQQTFSLMFAFLLQISFLGRGVDADLGDIKEPCHSNWTCNEARLTCDPEVDGYPLCRIRANGLCAFGWQRNHCVAGSWCSPFLGPEMCQCLITRSPNFTSGLCEQDPVSAATASVRVTLLTAAMTSLHVMMTPCIVFQEPHG